MRRWARWLAPALVGAAALTLTVTAGTATVTASGNLSQLLQSSIAFDSSTGSLYGITECCPAELVRIDPATGDEFLVAQLSGDITDTFSEMAIELPVHLRMIESAGGSRSSTRARSFSRRAASGPRSPTILRALNRGVPVLTGITPSGQGVTVDPAMATYRLLPSGAKLPGFGHPVHRPLDPRAERILELADARGVSGPHVLLARSLREAVAEASGKPLPMNVAMPIAAVMLDLGFPSAAVKAVPILARTASLLAHLAEEREDPIGLGLAAAADEAVDYEPDARS